MLFDRRFERLEIPTGGARINLVHAGRGEPLLLLHGYPQTHAMWHAVAPALANDYHVICPDLRGYGDSSKPSSDDRHTPYSKRAMATDMVEIMGHFGHNRFAVAGHDRGARVAHRLALDQAGSVSRLCVMDIVPTLHMFEHTDQAFATGYYHWFFLIQPGGLPERMIGADPDYFVDAKLGHWSAGDACFDPGAVAEYRRCFRNPDTVHASCEDYRAAAGIDLEHDRADRGRKLACPVLALWGERGFVQRTYDVTGVWRDYAERVEGRAIGGGHFLAEESPAAVIAELRRFLGAGRSG